MKLSVWSSYYYDLTPEDALREMKAHGFDYCEFSDEHAFELMKGGDPVEVGKEFGRFAKELGVELLQGHLFLRAHICKAEDRELLKKQFDLFEAIGIKNAVLHCDGLNYVEGEIAVEYRREANAAALAELLDYIKDTDIVICLENLRTIPTSRSADDLMWFIDRFSSKNLGICLDTGHLNLTPFKDQAQFIKTAGKHIKALHIADNEGIESDQHLMPFGRGNVDIVTVIREMKKLGYEGLYNLEIPGERNAPMEVLGYKLDYIKNVFAYLDRVTE